MKVVGSGGFFSSTAFVGGMVLWIGVDDTDSLQGMCTTFLATELVRELTRDFDLIGYPRLVRLNPNVPWKTRGNGAVCVRIGRGRGDSKVVGRIEGRDIRMFPHSTPGPEPRALRGTVASVVERWSRFEEEGTNPGFAILHHPPSPRLYWSAVRQIVSLPEALRAARGRGIVKRYKNGRGAIGALAATAWRPHDRTYEILSYREGRRWGTLRRVDPESVRRMDRAFPSTFNNYDFQNHRVVIAPRSPCPVLVGIRGDNPEDLPAAMARVEGEPSERWLLFETNQGTDDHVVTGPSPRVNRTVRMTGRVVSPARTFVGGHVVFRVDGLDVAAYEPSKQFRGIVRELSVGDRVRIVGAIRERPRTLNLEKIQILELAEVTRKVANPLCTTCGKRAKSLGTGAGYRCLRCGARFPAQAAPTIRVARSLRLGWYQPPVGARRHLSKPLERMFQESSDTGLGSHRLNP